MDIVAVIPARMGSTAYPGKPLCMIQGKTMIEHVYRSVEKTESVDETLVATPDQEIKNVVEDFGGKAVMKGTYNRPVGRVAEASKNIDAEKIITVHGDEPMIEPEMIEKTLKELDKKEVNCVNLVGNIETEEELKEVKKLVEETDDDRRTVITSDHGELFGKHGITAHSEQHPGLRLVPWLEVDGIN